MDDSSTYLPGGFHVTQDNEEHGDVCNCGYYKKRATKVVNAKRFLRYHYLKFSRLRGNPRSLARGAAIGAFMAILPIMPLRSIAIIASTIFIPASTLAALIVATVISNPFTYIPLYYFAFVVGNSITPFTLNWERVDWVLGVINSGEGFSASIQAVASLGLEALVVLIVGGIALAVPVGLITYLFSLRFFTNRRQKNHQV